MKTSYIITTAAVVVVVAAGAFYFVDVDQTQEAKLPNVDVVVEGGQAPDYEVNTGSVDVGTTERTVTVPEVTLKEKEVTVPTVTIEPAKE
jgi:cytochrome bd-type quinol oxidase subunit 1